MKKDVLLNKNIEISLLLDFYGALLTQKQSDYMHMHYEEDMSLAEIADIEQISRQAVHDTLKRAEETLVGYEKKLGFSAIYKKQNEILRNHETGSDSYKALQEMILAWEE